MPWRLRAFVVEEELMNEEMLSINPDDLAPRDAYRLMISSVVPRPIGWASTVSPDGAPNLAPYSFFNGVAGPPPVVMISVGRRAGQPKDTLRNVEQTGEFVINVVDETLAEQMNHTSGDWAYGESEFDLAGLAMTPSVAVAPPRVAAAAVALEAKVQQLVPVDGTSYTMVLGRVVRFHIRADLLRANGLVDAMLLRPVARLGGDEYATVGRVFELSRPQRPG